MMLNYVIKLHKGKEMNKMMNRMIVLEEPFEHKESSDYVVIFKGKWYKFKSYDDAAEFYREKRDEMRISKY